MNAPFSPLQHLRRVDPRLMNSAEADHLRRDHIKDSELGAEAHVTLPPFEDATASGEEVEDDDIAFALALSFAIGVLIFVAGAVVGHVSYPLVRQLLS